MIVELVELHVAFGNYLLKDLRFLSFRRYVQLKSILVVEAR